jgi:hypothetical protein
MRPPFFVGVTSQRAEMILTLSFSAGGPGQRSFQLGAPRCTE